MKEAATSRHISLIDTRISTLQQNKLLGITTSKKKKEKKNVLPLGGRPMRSGGECNGWPQWNIKYELLNIFFISVKAFTSGIPPISS